MWASIGALVAALLLALFVNIFATQTTYTAPTHTATSSALSILPELPPTLFLPPVTAPQATSSASSTAPIAKVPAKAPAKPTPAPAAPSPTLTSSSATQTLSSILQPVPIAPSGDLAAASEALRAALVNIICYAPAGTRLRSISGSGVIIDSRGIVLTNAHIGQYFLLANQGVSCTIRTGSPAEDAYKASLIFISPAWIKDNENVLTEDVPVGTGEHDLAFLAITGSATATPLPASFPSIPLEEEEPAVNEPVVIGSYAAQFLDTTQIQSSLYPTIVYGSIKQVFTFATNSVDVVSLGGSIAAQEGSSGGGIADGSGNLAATITTSTVEGDTSSRNLSAITATYIRRDVAQELGEPLYQLLDAPLASSIAAFAPSLNPLESLILAQFK